MRGVQKILGDDADAKLRQGGRFEIEYPRHVYLAGDTLRVNVPDPELRRQRIILRGDVPSPVNPPSGCRFNPRCQLRAELGGPAICVREVPPLVPVDGDGRDHAAACHFRGPGGAERAEAARATPDAGSLATSGLGGPGAPNQPSAP